MTIHIGPLLPLPSLGPIALDFDSPHPSPTAAATVYYMDTTSDEAATMRLERASRALGARVRGVDLGGPPDEETFASIRDSLNRHSVLIFSDQDVEPPAQIEFSGRFGRLKRHVLNEGLIYSLGVTETPCRALESTITHSCGTSAAEVVGPARSRDMSTCA